MTKNEAIFAAKNEAKRRTGDVSKDLAWNAVRFSTGWLVTAAPEDPLAITGGHCFVLSDGGGIGYESSSRPPSEIIARHTGLERFEIYFDDGTYTIAPGRGDVFIPIDPT